MLGEKWSRDKVARYFQVLNHVVTEVLEFCKKYQERRVTSNVTNVTF